MNKLKIGIDINEVLRAKWLQFDKFYVQEFGEEGVPKEQPYVYDFFNTYKWNDKVEIIKELKEPEDMPDDINPIHYKIDENTGEANADIFLFKKNEEIKLSAKEVYNRFMYEDFTFEIFGSASMMYKNMDLHVNEFIEKYKNTVDFIIFSKENQFSVPSTLFFLSKIRSRFNNYRFVENNGEIWDNVDVFITTDPEFLQLIPEGKKVIKLKRPYNENLGNDSIISVLQLHDLFENEEFEKLINYIKPIIK
jgi:hypothetical protein